MVEYNGSNSRVNIRRAVPLMVVSWIALMFAATIALKPMTNTITNFTVSKTSGLGDAADGSFHVLQFLAIVLLSVVALVAACFSALASKTGVRVERHRRFMWGTVLLLDILAALGVLYVIGLYVVSLVFLRVL